MELPDDWEMLQFSKNQSQGQCAFGDRYQFVMEFSWKKVDGMPDMSRTVSDQMAKLKERMREVGPLRQDAWLGIETAKSSFRATRFFRFFPDLSCIVQMVFVWPQKRNTDLERKILTNIRPERDTALRHWRAFGMELWASPDLPLESCSAEAAHSRMIFRKEEEAQVSEEFRRFGMVKEWLSGSVKSYLKNQMPGKLRDCIFQRVERAQHGIEYVTGQEPFKGLGRVVGKKICLQASAWICPHDGRLYYAVLRSLSESKEPFLIAGKRLACCGPLKAASGSAANTALETGAKSDRT